MVFILLGVLLLITGFAVGLGQNKEKTWESVGLFFIILAASFVLSFVFPIEWFINLTVPFTKQSIADFITSIKGLESLILMSPSLGDGVLDYVVNISRLFVMPFFVVASYLVILIKKIIVKINAYRRKEPKEKKEVNFLGASVMAIKFIIIFVVVISPISYISKIYNESNQVLATVNMSVCENPNDCATLDLLDNDILLKQVRKSVFLDKYFDFVSKQRSANLVTEIQNGQEMMSLVKTSGIDNIFDKGFRFEDMNENTFDFEVLDRLLKLSLESELLGQTVVDIFNTFVANYATELKKDFPEIQLDELVYDKKTLAIEMPILLGFMQTAFENDVFVLSNRIDLGVVSNMISNMGVKELLKMTKSVKNIKLVSGIDKHINVADTAVKKVIKFASNSCVITGMFLFENSITHLDEWLVEFRETELFTKLENAWAIL